MNTIFVLCTGSCKITISGQSLNESWVQIEAFQFQFLTFIRGGVQSTNFDSTMVPSDRSPPVPALYPPFLTKLLVGWQHKRQPITRDVRNSCPQGALFTNESVLGVCSHDGVIKWKHFPRYWPFVRGIPRSPVNSPHKGQWRGAFMFSFMFFLTWPLAGWQHSCQPIRSHVRNHCPLATISNESFLGARSIYGVRPHNNVISSPAVGTVPSIRASSVERGHRLATNPCAHRAQEHGQSNYIHQNSQWRDAFANTLWSICEDFVARSRYLRQG